MAKKFLISAMVLLLLFTAGCDEQNNPPSPEKKSPQGQITEQSEQKNNPGTENEKDKTVTEENKISEGKKKTLQVKIYFPDDAGMSLIPVTRQIKINSDEEKYFAVCKLLTEKPKEKNLTKIFPSNAKINGALRKGDTVFVNFDGSITKNFVGGSTGEEMLINSFVNTLTEFPEVNQVKFLIDGLEVETLSGHMDLSAPLKRIGN